MPLQSELIEVFLDHFHFFNESQDIESRYIILDVTEAINKADLTDEEKLILKRLYIDDRIPPQRDKIDKNGHTNGRPAGGTTQVKLAEELSMTDSKLNRIKQSAINKIALYLGEEYHN